MYAVLPDYPDEDIQMTYPQVLWSMGRYLVTYLTLVQACLLGFVSSACFAGFWTLLTFLLSEEPYEYNTFIIGLFGLLGAIGVLCAPFTGRLVDHIVPWFGQMLGVWVQLVGLLVVLGGAQINIAAVIITCIVFDLGLQLGQVSNSSRVANIDPKARARLNSCYILSLFLGQTTGTAVLTKLYNSIGWRPTAGVMVGALGFSQLVLLAHGPHTTKWFGWAGGTQLLKRKSASGHRTEIEIAKSELGLPMSTPVAALENGDERW